jgi:hypothetical protein
MQPRVLLDGHARVASLARQPSVVLEPGKKQIVATGLDGNSDVVGEGPDGLGWATNWLPNGRLLITGPELIRVEADGSPVRHADADAALVRQKFGKSWLPTDPSLDVKAPQV